MTADLTARVDEIDQKLRVIADHLGLGLAGVCARALVARLIWPRDKAERWVLDALDPAFGPGDCVRATAVVIAEQEALWSALLEQAVDRILAEHDARGGA